MNSPVGLAFDASGNLYVSNSGDYSIRKVTPGGVGSTFVSSGLNSPDGLAFDIAGNLYVANGFGGSVSKVTSSGTVSTFATGMSIPAGFARGSPGTLSLWNRGRERAR